MAMALLLWSPNGRAETTPPSDRVEADSASGILTPPAPASPRINSPSRFGVRPGSPFFYRIPASGVRPLEFSAQGLPVGLTLDSKTGIIRGVLTKPGSVEVLLGAKNAAGSAEKKFEIIIGESISLTPVMGWNSWNCWAESVDEQKVLSSAHALISSGLADHGWSYVNIDDTWQGTRSGKDHALQGNEKFPDMKRLCDKIHDLGLHAGIYSTPWITSYAKFNGGSSDAPDGAWSHTLAEQKEWRHGKYSFAKADANQWAAWGFDYLKYDWNPNDVDHTAEMSAALRASGRDIVFSLSNTAPYEHAADWSRLANSWRTTSDIRDDWAGNGNLSWQFGISEIGFSQERWAAFAGPGHWNDADMLVVGYVGWGPALHRTHLTPDEQYTHISLWCMLSSPLLIGCDLDHLDPFTFSLLTNDEVLAVNQDALGEQATRAASFGAVDVFLKKLEDGSHAVAFFNRGSQQETVTFSKLGSFGITGRQHLRDLWRQADLPDIKNPQDDALHVSIPAHGVVLYKVSSAQ
jgi:alpha-galactosidase